MARPITVLVMLLAALGLAGCDGGSEARVRTYTEQQSTITARVGDHFAIRLESNVTTGYRWKVTELPHFLVLVSDRYERPPTTSLGAPGTQVLRFEARDRGASTLELGYLRPFEPATPPARTVTFAVTVR